MPQGYGGLGLAYLQALAAEIPDGRCRDWPFPFAGRYPRVTCRGRYMQAGQASLIVSGQPRPRRRGMQALHSCDRTVCVAPWHLRWGTQRENIADAYARGRAPVGERHGRTHLTEKQVREIRESSEPNRVLAARYSVDPSTIGHIRRRETWVRTS